MLAVQNNISCVFVGAQPIKDVPESAWRKGETALPL